MSAAVMDVSNSGESGDIVIVSPNWTFRRVRMQPPMNISRVEALGWDLHNNHDTLHKKCIL